MSCMKSASHAFRSGAKERSSARPFARPSVGSPIRVRPREKARRERRRVVRPRGRPIGLGRAPRSLSARSTPTLKGKREGGYYCSFMSEQVALLAFSPEKQGVSQTQTSVGK